jgi:replicative DNA helicase
MNDIIPPQEPKFEEAVLGTLMSDKKAMPIVRAMLSNDDFYLDSHNKIYKAMCQLYKDKSPIDMLTVIAQLKKSKDLEIVGGSQYIAGLMTKQTYSIEHYCKVLAEKSMLRKQIEMSQSIIKQCYMPDADPFQINSVIRRSVSSIEKYEDEDYSSATRMRETREAIIKAIDNDGMAGIPTGIRKLDKYIGGITAGDYYVFSARSGSFKTALMLWIQHQVNIMGHPTLMFQQEMSRVQLGLREIALKTGMSTQDLRRGRVSEWKDLEMSVGLLENSMVYVDTSVNQTISKIKAKTQRYIDEHGIKFIVVDYLNLCDLEISKFGSEEQAIANHAKEMKSMAKELNIGILELVQFNKEAGKEPLKPPTMSMIKGSGAIEFSADVVCLFWNPAKYDESFVYDDGTEAKDKIAIIVAKNKNGDTGLFWHGVRAHNNQFYELDENFYPDKNIEPNREFDEEKF